MSQRLHHCIRFLDKAVEERTGKEMSVQLIEKVVKSHKCHRCAADFDKGFINEVVTKMRSSVM